MRSSTYIKMNYFHNSSTSTPWLPATHRRTPGATWEVGKRMRPGPPSVLPSFWMSQVGVMQPRVKILRRARRNKIASTICSWLPWRLSVWALPEWHLGTETAQVLPLFGDGTSLAAEQAPLAGIRVRGTTSIFRLVKCFHLHNRFYVMFVYFVCHDSIWLNYYSSSFRWCQAAVLLQKGGAWHGRSVCRKPVSCEHLIF